MLKRMGNDHLLLAIGQGEVFALWKLFSLFFRAIKEWL